MQLLPFRLLLSLPLASNMNGAEGFALGWAVGLLAAQIIASLLYSWLCFLKPSRVVPVESSSCEPNPTILGASTEWEPVD